MNHLQVKLFLFSDGGRHALEGSPNVCRACTSISVSLLWHADTCVRSYAQKNSLFSCAQLEKRKPKCTVVLSVTMFIWALTFMIEFCLQRSKSCNSQVELNMFYQLFELIMKEMCETSSRLENREAAWENTKIQIKITLKQVIFWWASEEVTSDGFILMYQIFSKFTTLLWSVGRKSCSCLLSVKSELHSDIGYRLNSTERLKNNKDYTMVIVFE